MAVSQQGSTLPCWVQMAEGSERAEGGSAVGNWSKGGIRVTEG